jgi:hypothetical protein
VYKSFATFVATAALVTLGCSKTDNKAPELLTQSPERTINQPTSVAGCLRAGVAENTFILNSSKADGTTAVVAATYQLTPAPGVDLRSYVGQDVELTGQLETERTVATSGESEQKPAKGVTDTPTVDTHAEVRVRKLDVSSVKPLGSRCE